MEWNTTKEKEVLQLRKEGMTYKAISEAFGATSSSVKHKVRRLQQNNNQDKYKHTKEKTEQFLKVVSLLGKNKVNILETNAGFGGMTEIYNKYGSVESYDIDAKRVDFINNQGFEGVQAIKGNSIMELYRLIAHKCLYNIVDIDPYGLPSRYFPHAFSLINDGLMFLTFPIMGVAQINKITIKHYQAFWGIELSDKDIYIDKIKTKLKDFAFQHSREVEFLDIEKIDRVYRIAMSVKKKSLCDIVGLIVNR